MEMKALAGESFDFKKYLASKLREELLLVIGGYCKVSHQEKLLRYLFIWHWCQHCDGVHIRIIVALIPSSIWSMGDFFAVNISCDYNEILTKKT